MLYKYLEQISGMGNRVDVPVEFESSADAEDFIDNLEPDDIVMDDVVDPETGEVLLEKGESKGVIGTHDDEEELEEVADDTVEDDDSLFGNYLDRARETGSEDTTDYKKHLQTLMAEYEAMGADIMGDWMYDHPDADDVDAEDFINSMADDAVSGGFDDEVEFVLRKNGIRDFSGWAADYIADGARKHFKDERG